MSMMTEEELNALLDKDDNTQICQEDTLSEDFINKWDTIFFTDGSCIGKKKGTKFGGSGVYCHNSSEVFIIPNKLKIFEKTQQEEVFIRKNSENIIEIKFIGSKENKDFLHYTCSEQECPNVAYCIDSNNKLMVCSRHKNENCSILYTYDNFTPTNIRSEGNAILISLKTILYSLRTDKFKLNRLKHFIQEIDLELISKNIYDINQFNVKKPLDEESENIVNNKFLIVSDSKFWIELITSWLYSWMKKNIVLEKKNNDLIIKIINILNEISHYSCYIRFIHINGHQDKKKEEPNFYHKGNILADKLATHASQSKENKLSIIS
jgi:ribonuclease HI